ncbi:MAG: serine/threonine protein kinase [Planctomycetaceae bacterium]|nr:serine/threonine protein kinase [Planctomycetaceae bacterium]
MQAPTAASDFFDLLEKSGLVTEERAQRIQEKLQISSDASAEAAARTLVRERVLTPFQAERLLEGRYRGLVIDGYRIREVLGFGGMGCVFIAEDPNVERKVALKVMSAEHALDAGMLARMKLEAAAGMKLDHPNIIKTYRLDSTGAVHYLVMELVRGISLHELVALNGPLKPSMACDVGMQIAEALDVAHRNGIIHRDIKPANFLIEPNGVARILDFGLAMISDVSDDEFSLSMVFGHDCLGTPDYISPEQSLDSRNIDARADIYSLGATLFVALTAHVPFPEKSNKAKLEAQRSKKPRNVCELRPEIPPEIGAIILKMMEKDPARRYQTAAEVVEAFRPFAKRKNVQFDFRELITLRAKQAKAKAEATGRKAAAPKSSITSASGWIATDGHDLGVTDSFAQADTPAIRSNSPEPSKSDRGSSTAPLRRVVHKGPAPAGWRIEVLGKKKHRQPLVKTKNAVGTGASDIRIQEEKADSVQCWIEYDGQNWQFRQESRKFPTYVNGQPEGYCILQHGSVLTFGGKTGIRIVNVAEEQRRKKLMSRLLIAIITLAVLAGAGWWAAKTFL